MEGQRLIAWNLRRIRVDRGLSQERLAADAGLDRAYVGGVERATANPTVAILDKLALALGVHISAFFLEPTPGEPPPGSVERRASAESMKSPAQPPLAAALLVQLTY